MPLKVIFTRPNADPITISIDLHGLKGNTRMQLSDVLIADISDNFSDQYIGANQELKSKKLEVTVNVLRLLGHENAVITCTLLGAVTPYNNTATIPFSPDTGIATHRITFIFK